MPAFRAFRFGSTVAVFVWMAVTAASNATAATPDTVSPQFVIRTAEKSGDEQAPVVSAVSLHPSGQILATAGDDHLVRIWDVTTGNLMHVLKGHTDWVRAASFAHDGSLLATAASDGQVIFWDFRTGNRIKTFLTQNRPIATIHFTPNGTQLVVTGFRCNLDIYDVATGQVRRSLRCPCVDMRALAISDDGQFMAGAGRNGVIRVWSLADADKGKDVPAHTQRVRALAFRHGTHQLVSGGEDRVVHVLDADSGQRLQRFYNASAKVFCLAVLDRRRVVTAGSDNVLRIFDIDKGELIALLPGHTGSVAAVDHVGRYLVSGGYDTTVRIWDVEQLHVTNPHAALLRNRPGEDQACWIECRSSVAR